MASGHTGNVVPRKGLRVRISCPPLWIDDHSNGVSPTSRRKHCGVFIALTESSHSRRRLI